MARFDGSCPRVACHLLVKVNYETNYQNRRMGCPRALPKSAHVRTHLEGADEAARVLGEQVAALAVHVVPARASNTMWSSRYEIKGPSQLDKHTMW